MTAVMHQTRPRSHSIHGFVIEKDDPLKIRWYASETSYYDMFRVLKNKITPTKINTVQQLEECQVLYSKSSFQ